jgi:tetratricopeptide (TPR) repeat protein
MKKVVCSVIAIILFSVLFGSCATLPPQQEELVEWSFVEHQFVLFEKEGNHTAAENFAREMMLEKWADWQVEALYYRLARSLYKQEKYKESLNLFRRLKDTKQFRPRVQLTAGEISLIMKRYDEALDWVLPVYLELKEEWKPGASRIIFLSYLYSRRIDNAAVWYSKLNEEKRAVLNEELNA